MAEGIIDKIMQAFKGMEKDEATLTAIEGGQHIELFGPGNEDAYKIGGDFDTIIKSLLNDKQGQNMYAQLVESGGIKQLESLWMMGGSPLLEYSDQPPTNASYVGRTNRRKMSPLQSGRDVGTILIHGGYERDSYSKFNAWIAELSHGIGHENPSMMKLGKKGEDDFSGPTSEFISGLESFPEPQSPQDSLALYSDYLKGLPSELQGPNMHDIEGSMEHTTHRAIQSALSRWLTDSLNIPIGFDKETRTNSRLEWGYEY